MIANIEDPNELPFFWTSHWNLHCLLKSRLCDARHKLAIYSLLIAQEKLNPISYIAS